MALPAFDAVIGIAANYDGLVKSLFAIPRWLWKKFDIQVSDLRLGDRTFYDAINYNYGQHHSDVFSNL